jgi:PGF-CTERM protein
VTASTSISDASPGTPGTTVEFNNGALNAITFSQEGVEGRVEVDDYGTNLPPGSPGTGDRPVLASVDVTVPDSVADEPATLRMTVDQTELLRAGVDGDEIAVLRETGGGYQMLDTTEVDSNGDVTVEAETPGFSTFIVSTDEGDIGLDDDTDAATDTPDEETPADDDGDEPAAGTDTPAEGTPPADSDDLPGFGVPIALVALLAAALLAARRNASE